MSSKKIAIISTSASNYEKAGYRTGLWLGELTHFYDVVEAAGFEPVIFSVQGGDIPIDPESLGAQWLAELGTDKRYADRAFMNRMLQTRAVDAVDPSEFAAIYLAGGHGCMFDFAQSEPLADLIRRFSEAGKVVSAVCHGPCGLLNVKLSNGDYLLKGKKATGFSWAEEELAQREQAVPYSLEDEMRQRGADYQLADEPFSPYVVADGLLITGQNPGSAAAVGHAVVQALGKDAS